MLSGTTLCLTAFLDGPHGQGGAGGSYQAGYVRLPRAHSASLPSCQCHRHSASRPTGATARNSRAVNSEASTSAMNCAKASSEKTELCRWSLCQLVRTLSPCSCRIRMGFVCLKPLKTPAPRRSKPAERPKFCFCQRLANAKALVKPLEESKSTT